jgi:hypothetical protein
VTSGLGCGLIAYFLFGTTDAIALGAKAGIFFWAALAIVVGVHRVTSTGNVSLAT